MVCPSDCQPCNVVEGCQSGSWLSIWRRVGTRVGLASEHCSTGVRRYVEAFTFLVVSKIFLARAGSCSAMPGISTARRVEDQLVHLTDSRCWAFQRATLISFAVLVDTFVPACNFTNRSNRLLLCPGVKHTHLADAAEIGMSTMVVDTKRCSVCDQRPHIASQQCTNESAVEHRTLLFV